MSVYESFAFLFLILSFFFKNNSKEIKWIFFISIFVLIAVAALRGLDVGTDTIHYYVDFLFSDRREKGDVVYYYLCDFFNKNLSYDAFLWFIYSIIVGGVSFVIYRMSNNMFFSLFLYVTLSFYTQSFNPMRQHIAVSLMFVAIYLLSLWHGKKACLIFFAFQILTFFVHHTSILSLFYIPLFYVKIKDQWWYVLLFGSFVFGIVFSSYLSVIFEPLGMLVDDYYMSYLDRANIGGSRNIISNAGLNLIGAVTLFLAPKTSENRWTVFFFVFSVILNNLFGWGYLTRMPVYFGIAQLIAIPMVYHSIKDDFLKYAYWVLIVGYSLSRFYFVTLHSDDIMPYYFR